MFCAHCGKALPDGSRFCSRCGAALPKIISNNQPTIMDEIKKVSFNLDEIKKAIPISDILTPGNIISIIGTVMMFCSVFQPVFTVLTGQSIPMMQLGIVAFFPVLVSVVGFISIITGKDNLYGIIATVGIGVTIILVVYTNILMNDSSQYYMGYVAKGTGIYVLIIAEVFMFVGLIIREKMKGTDSN